MGIFGRLFGSPAARLAGTDTREVVITSFCASIDSYVSLAEELPLPVLQEVLNQYFGVACEELERHGAMVDKFVGDAVLACLGIPRELPDHEAKACGAALALQRRMVELRREFARDQSRWSTRLGGMRIRVGIGTGAAIAGNFGSATRFTYTAMGDCVNVAARLETGAKTFAAAILCTGETRDGCERADKSAIVFRPLGRAFVRGRAAPLDLYEPLALHASAPAKLLECCAVFAEGLACYQEANWERAIECFRKSAALEPKDTGSDRNPSAVFLEWSERARESPPERILTL